MVETENFIVSLTCKKCCRENVNAGRLITHRSGKQTVEVNIPKYCVWCLEEKERKEKDNEKKEV